MLTPLLLFVIHVNELSNDIKLLKAYYSNNMIWTVLAAGIILIPSFITINYINDRTVLNETLDYLYKPDYSKSYKIDRISLQKTLNVVKYYKGNNRDVIFGNQIPYLSSYYNWIVLGNLTLSDSKINTIERVFFGQPSYILDNENLQNKNVEITKIDTESKFDKSQNTWISRIDLEISNKSKNLRTSEYSTTFELPEGTWISNYYLYIDNRKEMGIIAEKKAAMWVFSNIRNQNRDPGILYYLTGNRVAFRVFPFAEGEMRRTGIEFLHKEPITISIDGNTIKLGQTERSDNTVFENENPAYISALQKQDLKKIQRRPYFHFIVDITKKDKINELARRIEKLIEKNKSLAENAKISFVNSYVSTFTLDKKWKDNLQSQNSEGGFYLDRAIKSVMFDAYRLNAATYPVIVVVTDNIDNAIIDSDFADWSFAYPESNQFYNLKDNGTLESHSLIYNPLKIIQTNATISSEIPVIEYRFKNNSIAYLPDNGQASIVLKSDNFEIAENDIKEKNFASGLTMQGMWRSQILHPEKSDLEWLNLVKYSFRSKIMMPVTSYLAVENEAQKAILKKKQSQVLSGNKSLDPGEETQPMSEPGLILMTILLGFILLIRYKSKWIKSGQLQVKDL
jgi:hypothetical protein